MNAIAAKTEEAVEKRRQIDLALKQARYEATLARRQYDAVDPDNRLVAGELERRWNEKLMAVRALEDQIEEIEARRQPALSDERARAAHAAGRRPRAGVVASRRHHGDPQADRSRSAATRSWCASRTAMSTLSCTGRAATTRR